MRCTWNPTWKAFTMIAKWEVVAMESNPNMDATRSIVRFDPMVQAEELMRHPSYLAWIHEAAQIPH